MPRHGIVALLFHSSRSDALNARRSSSSPLLVVRIPAVLLVLLASSAGAWQTNISGPPISSFDEGHDVAVDPAGDVVAAGFLQGVTTSRDFLVVKLSGTDGTVRWQRIVGPAYQGLQRVTLDPAGNVVTAGSNFAAWTLTKLDGATGAPVWTTNISGTLSDSPQAVNGATAVTMDRNGDVIGVGFTTNAGTQAGSDFTLIKLSAETGTEMWRTVIDGGASLDDEALAVAVDPVSDVAAAGFITDASGVPDFTVIKLSGATGRELWRHVISEGNLGLRIADAVAVDAAGNVFAAGTVASALTVVKLAGPSGTELWRRDVVGSVGGGRASALVLDPVGNPVTCGYTVNVQNDPLNPAALDFTVAKFEAVTGANVWQRTLSGTAPNSGDECLALTENSAGDVLAVGYFDDAGTGIDFAVVKLSGADGTELWRRAIDGIFSGQLEGDLAFAAATDTDGNVVAVGRTKNNGTGVDFTVAKLSGVDGAVGLVTAPPPCCQDAECADSDPCTIDSCTSVGCVSQQGPTFVDCRLGAAEEALGTILMIIRDAQPKKLGGKVQAQRLTAEVTRSRHLIAGARRNSHTARKKLRKAEALLTHFRGAVVFGAREGKIDPELAQRLLALLPCRRLLGAPPLSCSLL